MQLCKRCNPGLLHLMERYSLCGRDIYMLMLQSCWCPSFVPVSMPVSACKYLYIHIYYRNISVNGCISGYIYIYGYYFILWYVIDRCHGCIVSTYMYDFYKHLSLLGQYVHVCTQQGQSVITCHVIWLFAAYVWSVCLKLLFIESYLST